jgi:ABC-type uncharacterized transport system fused permease/ATPase subunit
VWRPYQPLATLCRARRAEGGEGGGGGGNSVGFSFLGRDFYNSIAEKNADVRTSPLPLSSAYDGWSDALSPRTHGYGGRWGGGCVGAQDFQRLLLMYTGAIAAGIPVFVLRDFFRERLSLRWREWMTGRFVGRYFDNRNFYRIQVRHTAPKTQTNATPNRLISTLASIKRLISTQRVWFKTLGLPEPAEKARCPATWGDGHAGGGAATEVM